MKFLSLFSLFTVVRLGAAEAESTGKLLFSDDFSRRGSALENGWTSNPGAEDQVVIKEGAMHIETSKDAGHRASIRHELGFRNGSVSLKVLLPGKQDTMTLDFADPKEKSVHSGHLFAITFSAESTRIEDLKTGRSAVGKTGKALTSTEKKALRDKKLILQKGVSTGEWRRVTVTIKGDLTSVFINEEMVGELVSEGFAHPIKRLLRVAVPGAAVIDDVRIISFD